MDRWTFQIDRSMDVQIDVVVEERGSTVVLVAAFISPLMTAKFLVYNFDAVSLVLQVSKVVAVEHVCADIALVSIESVIGYRFFPLVLVLLMWVVKVWLFERTDVNLIDVGVGLMAFSWQRKVDVLHKSAENLRVGLSERI